LCSHAIAPCCTSVGSSKKKRKQHKKQWAAGKKQAPNRHLHSAAVYAFKKYFKIDGMLFKRVKVPVRREIQQEKAYGKKIQIPGNHFGVQVFESPALDACRYSFSEKNCFLFIKGRGLLPHVFFPRTDI
jgi:hypothetical protein